MADSVFESKEVWTGLIALGLSELVKYTGVAIPITPEQILAVGIAVALTIRVLWTKGKITSIMPK